MQKESKNDFDWSRYFGLTVKMFIKAPVSYIQEPECNITLQLLTSCVSRPWDLTLKTQVTESLPTV